MPMTSKEYLYKILFLIPLLVVNIVKYQSWVIDAIIGLTALFFVMVYVFQRKKKSWALKLLSPLWNAYLFLMMAVYVIETIWDYIFPHFPYQDDLLTLCFLGPWCIYELLLLIYKRRKERIEINKKYGL
jgi:hypothetical protein